MRLPAIARQKALGAHVLTETAPTGGALVPAGFAQVRGSVPIVQGERAHRSGRATTLLTAA